MGGEAADWWRQVSRYADIVRESYFRARTIAKQGPVEGSRTLRTMFRNRVQEFTSVGIPTSKLGLMLGFQTTRGAGGREGAPRKAWLEVTKLQTLAARQVAGEKRLRSIWSWGWGVWTKAQDDPDKPAAACVYLWTRDPKLCNGPELAGPSFNASRTEGQLVLGSGVRCTLYGRPISAGSIAALTPVTGDRDAAFSAAFGRAVAAGLVPLKAKQVALAEKAVVASRFGGSYGRYRAALAKAHASVGAARGVIADELRRMTIKSKMRVGSPSSADMREYYETYGEAQARLVQTKTAAPWLGNRKRGFALESTAPPQLFSIPQGGWHKVRTMRGVYEVRALDATVPLGAIPFALARAAVSNALRQLAQDDRYDRWLLARERALVDQALCRRDVQPRAELVPLTDYLPFLAGD
jgi:hypothetical protein